MAQATYQGLMDQMEYTNRLANVRAQQSLQRAETELRVAREQLRVLGVRPTAPSPRSRTARSSASSADGSLPHRGAARADPAKPDAILTEVMRAREPRSRRSARRATPTRSRRTSRSAPMRSGPPSTGTILDRELIVPGVAVDTTHRIFTMANLATVWVEVAIHESDFGALPAARTRRSFSVAGLSRPQVQGRGDLHGRPRRREEPDHQAPGPRRKPRPRPQAGHVRRGRSPAQGDARPS